LFLFHTDESARPRKKWLDNNWLLFWAYHWQTCWRLENMENCCVVAWRLRCHHLDIKEEEEISHSDMLTKKLISTKLHGN